MAQHIKPLPPTDINLIDSEQLIASPTALVKELVENAIDSGATNISVLITANTLGRVEVRDNGSGVSPDDINILGRPGCTSKLRSLAEISSFSGATYGFRGQALAAIASLATITITTKTVEEMMALEVKLDKNNEGTRKCKLVNGPVGTTVVATDLFRNQPIRAKIFQKEANKTVSAIKNLLTRYALCKPAIKLSLRVFQKPSAAWNCPSNKSDSLQPTVVSVLGVEVTNECLELKFGSLIHKDNQLTLITDSLDSDPNMVVMDIFIIKPYADISKVANKGFFLSVDSRPLDPHKRTAQKLKRIYRGFLARLFNIDIAKIREPFLRLNIKCLKGTYDPNIDPAKDDVMFACEDALMLLFTRLCAKVYEDALKNTQHDARQEKVQCTEAPLVDTMTEVPLLSVAAKLPVTQGWNEQNFSSLMDIKLEHTVSKNHGSKVARLGHQDANDDVAGQPLTSLGNPGIIEGQEIQMAIGEQPGTSERHVKTTPITRVCNLEANVDSPARETPKKDKVSTSETSKQFQRVKHSSTIIQAPVPLRPAYFSVENIQGSQFQADGDSWQNAAADSASTRDNWLPQSSSNIEGNLLSCLPQSQTGPVVCSPGALTSIHKQSTKVLPRPFPRRCQPAHKVLRKAFKIPTRQTPSQVQITPPLASRIKGEVLSSAASPRIDVDQNSVKSTPPRPTKTLFQDQENTIFRSAAELLKQCRTPTRAYETSQQLHYLSPLSDSNDPVFSNSKHEHRERERQQRSTTSKARDTDATVKTTPLALMTPPKSCSSSARRVSAAATGALRQGRIGRDGRIDRQRNFDPQAGRPGSRITQLPSAILPLVELASEVKTIKLQSSDPRAYLIVQRKRLIDNPVSSQTTDVARLPLERMWSSTKGIVETVKTTWGEEEGSDGIISNEANLALILYEMALEHQHDHYVMPNSDGTEEGFRAMTVSDCGRLQSRFEMLLAKVGLGE